jgi:hypothetical protein
MCESDAFVREIEVWVDGWLDYFKGAPEFVSDVTLHRFLFESINDKFHLSGVERQAIDDWLWEVVESGEVRRGTLDEYLI